MLVDWSKHTMFLDLDCNESIVDITTRFSLNSHTLRRSTWGSCFIEGYGLGQVLFPLDNLGFGSRFGERERKSFGEYDTFDPLPLV